jgi:hemoglobin
MSTLYERIGGEENVKKMVTAFYQRVLSDSLISPFFENTEIEKLEKMQVAFFTIALGGDEPPKMPSLLESHRGRGIESKHLTRFTELLVETLEEVGIPENEIKEVYARISTYSNDVLGETSIDG